MFFSKKRSLTTTTQLEGPKMVLEERDVQREFRRSLMNTTTLLGMFRHRFEGSLDGDTHVLLVELEQALQPVHDRLNTLHLRR